LTHLRIATRRSPLALWQAEFVAAELERHFPEVSTELVKIKTTGEAAEQWMAIAQCFAGPPEDPPPPGARG